MAYPQWLTPAGNLGIVPSAEYYQFALDAYDTAGGTLNFFKLSGELPPGLQIVQSTGNIQGIPLNTAGADINQTHTFTVRVVNLSDNLIADRTFSITVTNVAPPIIVPKSQQIEYQLLSLAGNNITANIGDVIIQPISGAAATVTLANVVNSPSVSVNYTSTTKFTLNTGNLIVNNVSVNSYPSYVQSKITTFAYDLGMYFDGQVLSEQLRAVEFIVEDNLVWSLKDGTLPPGISISPSGLLSGYINLIPALGPSSTPQWDSAEWDEVFTVGSTVGHLGWDAPIGTTSKHFTFTLQVTDGARTDTSVYNIYVIPRASLSADSTMITIDSTTVNGKKLTIDTGDRHDPIITTLQTDLVPERQGSWFTHQIGAIDLDGDVLQYKIPSVSQGSFDEQSTGSNIPYVKAVVTNGNISVGAMLANLSVSNPLRLIDDVPALISGAPIQVLYPYTDLSSSQTTLTWYNANVTSYTTVRLSGNTRVTASAGQYITQSVASANAIIQNVSATTGTISVVGNVRANIGDFITQSSTGANATITTAHGSFDANTQNPFVFNVTFTSGNFAIGSGNISINGTVVVNSSETGNSLNPWANIGVIPNEVICSTDITAIYTDSHVFRLNATDSTGIAYINGSTTNSYPSAITHVGVDLQAAPSLQGTEGFDETKFDQGTLVLPQGITMDIDSGWVTGFLPAQTANSTEYNFEVVVYKRDFPVGCTDATAQYKSTQLLTLTVLGDLNNKVTWLTPSNLGTIENGSVSDLSVTAISSVGKTMYYLYTPGSYINVPQGLKLQPDGLISGRVSFELFSLDAGVTTFDAVIITGDPATTFDRTFEFSITAITFDQTASDTRRFTVLVRERNIKPYENLYLKAFLGQYQKLEFRDIIQDQSVFPSELIYRNSDPWFGLADNIRMLYLPGLNPSTSTQYATALNTNHFNKRLLFNNIKTAVARQDGVYDVFENATGNTVGTYNVYTGIFVPTDFSSGYVVTGYVPFGTTVGDQHIKYEVVYADILDENSNSFGKGPADTINLRGIVDTPYYDPQGNAFIIATPNSFTNMDDAVINNIGYADKGVLPDWMTSTQRNGAELGFVRAVVLAYTKPGASETIAWRFKQKNYDLNQLNFTVDRYILDDSYSANYDLAANAFVTSPETTFDRYPALSSIFNPVASVDYAVNRSFESINERAYPDVIASGGLDGITSFKTGETLVFFEQEFTTGIDISDSDNQGWTDSLTPWDDPDVFDADWDHDGSEGWDSAAYVPGYKLWLASKTIVSSTAGSKDVYSVPNQRASIWKVTIDGENFVRLSLANITATSTLVTANTTGFGSNITLPSTDGIFVGMHVVGAGMSNSAIVTDIVGGNVTVFPNVASTSTSTLTFMPTINYNNSLFVRTGFTHGGVNIYFDPYVKEGKLVPNYSKIPQQIKTTSTTFDGNGTKFFDYRTSYSVPEQGDKFIKFPRINVFD